MAGTTTARELLLARVPNPLNILTRTTWTDQPKRAARVWVADGLLRVFVSGPGASVELLEEVEGVTLERSGRVWKIGRPDGSVLEVSRAGCGCGTSIKNFNPAKWSP